MVGKAPTFESTGKRRVKRWLALGLAAGALTSGIGLTAWALGGRHAEVLSSAPGAVASFVSAASPAPTLPTAAASDTIGAPAVAPPATTPLMAPLTPPVAPTAVTAPSFAAAPSAATAPLGAAPSTKAAAPPTPAEGGAPRGGAGRKAVRHARGRRSRQARPTRPRRPRRQKARRFGARRTRNDLLGHGPSRFAVRGAPGASRTREAGPAARGRGRARARRARPTVDVPCSIRRRRRRRALPAGRTLMSQNRVTEACAKFTDSSGSTPSSARC